MNKQELIWSLLIASVAVAMLEFTLFFAIPDLAFTIHNAFSVLVGLGLTVYGYRLLKAGIGDKNIHTFTMLIGVLMVSIHITKLFIGKVF